MTSELFASWFYLFAIGHSPQEDIDTKEVFSKKQHHLKNKLHQIALPVRDLVLCHQMHQKWIRSWILVNETVVVATDSSPSTLVSFEELILHKIKDSSKKETKKRRKIDLKTRVVTDDDFYPTIKEKEENEPKKGGLRKRGRSTKNAVQAGAECNISAGKRQQRESDIANDEAISEDSTDSNDSMSDSKQTNNGKEVGEIQKEQKSQESAAKNRGNTEESLAMEISLITEQMDDDKKDLFYCLYYGDQFYWGKVQKTFAQDPDDNADTMLTQC